MCASFTSSHIHPRRHPKRWLADKPQVVQLLGSPVLAVGGGPRVLFQLLQGGNHELACSSMLRGFLLNHRFLCTSVFGSLQIRLDPAEIPTGHETGAGTGLPSSVDTPGRKRRARRPQDSVDRRRACGYRRLPPSIGALGGRAGRRELVSMSHSPGGWEGVCHGCFILVFSKIFCHSILVRFTGFCSNSFC